MGFTRVNLQLTHPAEGIYEEWPPTRGPIHVPLINDDLQQHKPGGSGSGCNTMARVFATLLSGLFCAWSLIRFISFILGSLGGDGRYYDMVVLAWILFLADISGSLVSCAAGCTMACYKSCCAISIVNTPTLAIMQLIGSVVCILAEFGWMICIVEHCRNGSVSHNSTSSSNSSPGDWMNDNYSMGRSNFGPKMAERWQSVPAGGGNSTGGNTIRSDCFEQSYFMGRSIYGGWGIFDLPICIVLLGCTCASVFKK